MNDLKCKEIEAVRTILNKFKQSEKELKENILEKYPNDFDVWLEFAKKEDYDYISDMEDGEIKKIIGDIAERYETVTLDDILEYYDYDVEEPNDNIDFLKEELMKLNFGSVTYDW